MASSAQGRRVPPTDGKRRALTVRLLAKDGRGRFDKMERLRYQVLVVLFVAALIAGITYLVIKGDQSSMMFSPGPVSRAHQSFEHDCNMCHAAGDVIRGDNVAADCTDKWGSPTEQKCRACHPVSGIDDVSADGTPPELNDLFPIGQHSLREDPTKVARCSACHHEHVGSSDLTQMSDRTCTQCHGDLTSFVIADANVEPGKLVHAKITRFDMDHPDFPSLAALEQDPGQLKFNHKKHLAQSLPNIAGDKVQLSCRSCHEPSGRNMVPPSFNKNCKDCHALYYDGGERELPHGLFASQIAALLKAELPLTPESAPDEANEGDWVARAKVGRPNLPRPVELEWPLAEVGRSESSEDRIAMASNELSHKCQLCHYFDAKPTASLPLPDIRRMPTDPPRLVKDQWLHSARFDHRTHAGHQIACTDCHTMADPANPNASEKHTDILVSNRSVCVKCHSEEASAQGELQLRGGYNCLTCHRYHNASGE